jgi:hypothetical protein
MMVMGKLLVDGIIMIKARATRANPDIPRLVLEN